VPKFELASRSRDSTTKFLGQCGLWKRSTAYWSVMFIVERPKLELT
jgi:hypothetical protein